ncbi:16S rRNA (guanine(966)-N(2))-methyltransferase RsmD [Gordonia sp. NPDC003585]|uniref:16S rRNA (guanine(966)-N(2))-methyltransferase RsmD n=1 Tax=unclassified Gordonia (in: high G+C Gram-positive bacteria) TaxID=2657482 RepID=UPI0033AF237A
MTRIIAGRLRGRRLKVPDEGTRPTSDRVRESVFNMLEHRCDLAEARVLDLYAGSGALGLEAISRGAASATLVDSGRKAAATIADNARSCGVADSVTVVNRSVGAYLAGPTDRAFDLVFADPPYDVDVSTVRADMEAVVVRLAAGALVVLERSARAVDLDWPDDFEVVVDKKYGDTRVEVARHDG